MRKALILAVLVACKQPAEPPIDAGMLSAPEVDRWGSELSVVCSSDGPIEVVSLGPDKTIGTADDISSVRRDVVASEVDVLRVKKDAGMLASLIAKWEILQHGACIRDIEDLMRLSNVEPESLVDPWGSKYTFTCIDGRSEERAKCVEGAACPEWGVTVTSPGVDKISGTADDITVSE